MEIELKNTDQIRTEPNPFFREIWAAGYDKIIDCPVSQTTTLVNTRNKTHKVLQKSEINKVVMDVKIIGGILPNGATHHWIKEADGSAQKFRVLINPIEL